MDKHSAMTDMHREGLLAERQHFEQWYLTQGKYSFDPIGGRDCSMQWEAWQAAMRYRDEQEQTSVWRCYKEYMSGDGGRVHSEKFAKTKADMLIFKSQGYDCEKLCDEQEKQA